MARRAEGWRLVLDKRSGVYGVRWRSGGVRRYVSTGLRDPGEAAQAAARLYAATVSGRRVDGQRRIRVDECGAEWLADLSASRDETTVAKYTMYLKAWASDFGTLENVTDRSVEDWWRARLRVVKRRTVIKQLYALHGMLVYARGRGWIAEVPRWDPPPKSATGTPTEGRTPVETVPLSETEAERVIAALPEWSDKAQANGKKWRVRDRFLIAWETALRPATLDAIRAPGDYRKGALELAIRDEIDKARFGRAVPLTPRAREALDRCVPDVGPILSRVDSHVASRYLRAAAEAAGLDARRASRIKAYDLRHARLTLLAERAPNLVGVAYLAGHKALTTTNRYVHAHRTAAEEALASIGMGSGRAGGSKGLKRGKVKR